MLTELPAELPTLRGALAVAEYFGATVTREPSYIVIGCRCGASLTVPGEPFNEALTAAEILRWLAFTHGC